MSYAPTTDFIALLRQTSGGMRFLRVPGLDFMVAGLARAGLFLLWTGQAAPTINQAKTLWFKPALSSWAAEGVVFLWNAADAQYELATPALWEALFTASAPTVFQSVNAAGPVAIASATSLLAVQRAAPVNTALTLPAVASRNGKLLRVVDWSTAVAGHEIDVTAAGGETIMQRATFKLFSTADQLAGVQLYPSIDLTGWVIAP